MKTSMREPTYSQALSHAWELVWHNKILWIFGLLSLLLGQFGLSNFLGRLTVIGGEGSWLVGMGNYGLSWSLFSELPLALSIWLGTILAALFVLILVPVVAAEGALIAVATTWYKKGKVLDLTKAWHKGVKHFWRLLIIEVVKKGSLFGLVCLMNRMTLTFLASENLSGQIFTILSLAVGLIIALAVTTIAIFSAGYVIVEEDSLLESVKMGAQLFSRHLLVSLELNIIWLFITILLLTAVLLLGGWLMLPLAILGALATATGQMFLVGAGMMLSIVFTVLVAGLLGAIFNAFTISAWMYLFMKMHHEGLVGRLFHFGRALFKK